MKTNYFFIFLLLILRGLSPLSAATISWANDADGIWSNGGNWVGGSAPVLSTDNAVLGTVITAPRVVTFDTAFSIESLTAQGTQLWTLSGTELLSLSGASGTALSLENATINTPLSLSSGNIYKTGTTGTVATISQSMTLGSSTLFSLNGVASATPDMDITSQINGFGAVNKSGSGTLRFSGSNTYSGGTTISSGTLIVNSDSNLGNSSGDLTFTGGVFDNATLRTTTSFSTNRDIAVPGIGIIETDTGTTLTLTGVISGINQLQKTGDGTLVITGTNTFGGMTLKAGVVSISASANLGNSGGLLEFQGGTLNISSNLTLSQPIPTIVGSGTFDVNPGVSCGVSGNIFSTGTLIKSGDGTLFLNGTNTYSGGTIVNAGTLVGDANSLQGNIANSSSVIFSIFSDGAYNGILSGSGTLTKEGTGKLILSGPNTYSGGTIVSNGTLQGTTTSLQGNILNNASVIFDQVGNGTYAGVISGTGSVSKSSGGVVTISGTNSYSGGTTFSGGALRIDTDTNLGDPSGSLTFDGGELNVFESFPMSRSTNLSSIGTFNIDSGKVLTQSGTIIGGGILSKSGPGTLILTGSNSYTGGILLNSGVLQGTTDSLKGDILNDGAVIFDQSFNGTYAGGISGGGSVAKSSTGTVIFTGTNNFTGGTTVSDGILQGTTSSLPGDISNSASVVFDQAGSGTYAGIVSGAGSLSKKGSGEVTFTGNSAAFTGATTIEEGSFIVNGTMSSSPFTVNIATLLGGTGSIGTTVNNGTVSPGNSIGTINIVGDYTQNANGSLLVEIDDMGHSDLLIATGTANLDGSVVVTPLPGLYMDGMMYTILQANSVNGAFAQLIESHPADFYLTYFAQSVVLNIGKEQFAILPVSLSSLKSNAKAIGNYLFACDPNYSPALIPIIDNLLHQKPDEFRQTLLQFGPQDFGALEKTQMQTATMISHSMNQARDWSACQLQDSTLWVEPLGYYYKDNEKGGLTPYNAKSFGFTTGYKKRLWDHFLLSGGIGYSHTRLNWYENRGDATVQSLYLSPGIAYQSREAYAGLMLQGSRSFYSADRKIHSKVITACYIPCIDETAHNHHKSWDILAGFQGGYRFKTSDHFLTNFYIVPSFHLDYLNIFEEGYRETGAGPINLSVKNKHSAFFRSEFLVRFMKELNIGPFRSFPNIYVGYLMNFALSRGHFSSHFYKQSLCGNHFTVKGSHQNTSQLILGTELESVCFHNISLKIGYEANIGDHYNIQKGHLKGEWNF